MEGVPVMVNDHVQIMRFDEFSGTLRKRGVCFACRRHKNVIFVCPTLQIPEAGLPQVSHDPVVCARCFFALSVASLQEGAVPRCPLPECGLDLSVPFLRFFGWRAAKMDSVVAAIAKLEQDGIPEALRYGMILLVAFVAADGHGHFYREHCVYYQESGVLNPVIAAPQGKFEKCKYYTIQFHKELQKFVVILWRTGMCYSYDPERKEFAKGCVSFFDMDHVVRRRMRSQAEGGVFQRTRQAVTQEQYEAARKAGVTEQLRRLRVVNLVDHFWGDIDVTCALRDEVSSDDWF
jgi:hypothetical protein